MNTYGNLVKGIETYVTSSGMKTMILGISGGIDSTVSAVICQEVSKRTGVKLIGVSLMCDTNKNDEVTIADQVGELFCDEYYKVNLQDLYKTTSDFFKNSSAVNGNSTKISEGNIKARLRMMYLWNLGGLRNGVVIDTDNLTEHYLGFWTLMGDSNYITPIGNLWKTEVYQLAKDVIKSYEQKLEWNDTSYEYGYMVYINDYNKLTETQIKWYESAIKVLNDVIKIVPTDGNGVSNSDLEQIGGKSYDEVDDILKTVVTGKFNVDEYVKLVKKYGVETVDKVINRYKNSEFKRKHLPLSINPYNGEVVEQRIV